MKKVILWNLCILLLAATQSLAQTHTVTGKVTSKDDGLPLPGVTVTIKATTTGTQTNAEGKFSINAPVGARRCRSALLVILRKRKPFRGMF